MSLSGHTKFIFLLPDHMEISVHIRGKDDVKGNHNHKINLDAYAEDVNVLAPYVNSLKLICQSCTASYFFSFLFSTIRYYRATEFHSTVITVTFEKELVLNSIFSWDLAN